MLINVGSLFTYIRKRAILDKATYFFVRRTKEQEVSQK